jgi:hypothetical protein
VGYPQFCSRVGFVHEFRPFAAKEVRGLLDRRGHHPASAFRSLKLGLLIVAAGADKAPALASASRVVGQPGHIVCDTALAEAMP